MTRLSEAAVVTLEWTEDEDTVYADGHQSYEIDANNEIAIFHDAKCVDVRTAMDFTHAVAMVMAMESCCSYNLRNGCDFHNRKVDERGCVV